MLPLHFLCCLFALATGHLSADTPCMSRHGVNRTRPAKINKGSLWSWMCFPGDPVAFGSTAMNRKGKTTVLSMVSTGILIMFFLVPSCWTWVWSDGCLRICNALELDKVSEHLSEVVCDSSALQKVRVLPCRRHWLQEKCFQICVRKYHILFFVPWHQCKELV